MIVIWTFWHDIERTASESIGGKGVVTSDPCRENARFLMESNQTHDSKYHGGISGQICLRKLIPSH
jgi:hypothetical protein